MDDPHNTAYPENVGPGSAFVRGEMLSEMPAPISTSGPIGWIRTNLFPNVPQAILTLVCLYVLYVIIPPIVQFLFVNAQFSGTDRAACATEVQGGTQPEGWFGACWAYVGAYANQFIYGRYPDEEQWRVNITGLLFFGGLIPLLIPDAPYKRENLVFILLIFPIVALVLLTGGHFDTLGLIIPTIILSAIACGVVFFIARGSGSDPKPGMITAASVFAGIIVVLALLSIDFGLAEVETEVWGGLLVTLVIAVTGIAASLPIGILLALGRRSDMPIVKFFCVVFIEFWRGVPLITVLFMSSVMLPLFLPEGVTFDKLLRALIGVALFSSAYMAEVVRGGLQALPKGQYEGAMALGLGWGQMMRMIILPQALKLVIPGIVNTFIGLFKDTTLVLIIGLFDFLGQIQSSFTDPTWASPVQSLTGYFFAAIVYFFFCYAMSRYSMFMERRLDTGHRS
ncbi:MAG: amino acid ABC transporter permease [Pseudomonadota bacterium]